jgi:hypothetical protein
VGDRVALNLVEQGQSVVNSVGDELNPVIRESARVAIKFPVSGNCTSKPSIPNILPGFCHGSDRRYLVAAIRAIPATPVAAPWHSRSGRNGEYTAVSTAHDCEQLAGIPEIKDTHSSQLFRLKVSPMHHRIAAKATAGLEPDPQRSRAPRLLSRQRLKAKNALLRWPFQVVSAI